MNLKSEITDSTKEIRRLEDLLFVKERELNLLLQVTQAINDNMSATGLLKLYEDILTQHIGVGKLALFTNQDSWVCSNFYGVEWKDIAHISDEYLPQFRHLVTLKKIRHPLSKIFDVVVPVYHKNLPLTFTFLGGINSDKKFSLDEKLNYIQVISNIIAVAIENKKLSRSQKKNRIMKSEMELAQQMQTMLMPGKLPNNERIQISAFYLPHLEVGGDYYDYIELNEDECLFCIGDISGKGIAAALLMANFQASVRSFADKQRPLHELIENLNQRVNEITKGEKHITFFLSKFNFKTREYQYINAGHNPAILYHDGKIKLLEEGCTILGMFEKLPYVHEQTIQLEKESITFCYTDGLTDMENEKKQKLELHHLSEFIEENHDLTADDLNKILIDYLVDFKGSRLITDDVSILTCKIF